MNKHAPEHTLPVGVYTFKNWTLHVTPDRVASFVAAIIDSTGTQIGLFGCPAPTCSAVLRTPETEPTKGTDAETPVDCAGQ